MVVWTLRSAASCPPCCDPELVKALPTLPTREPSLHNFPNEFRKYCICAHLLPRYGGAPKIFASAADGSPGRHTGRFLKDLLNSPETTLLVASSAIISGTRTSFTSAPSTSSAPCITACARLLVCPSDE